MAAPQLSRQQLSRQQRRKAARDAMERGRRLLTRGLGPEIDETDALGLALLLHEWLTSTEHGGATAAAAMAEALLEKSLKAEIKAPGLGCAKGCTYCCSAIVTCSAPEIFRVVDFLRATASLPTAPIKLEAARRLTLTTDQSLAQRSPCPMLVGGACSVYQARPIACRALLSNSSESCRLALDENIGQPQIVVPAMTKGEIARTLLLAAVSAAGLPDRGIELSAGVAAVLDHPDAETRGLAGEDIFAHVLGAERLPAARTAQDRLAALVRQLVD